MKFIKTGLVVAALLGTGGTLGACSTFDDGYGYSGFSVGVSSGPGYHYPHSRRDRDGDGDGIPNRYDFHPNNPYRP